MAYSTRKDWKSYRDSWSNCQEKQATIPRSHGPTVDHWKRGKRKEK